jgi:hypothetical protein
MAEDLGRASPALLSEMWRRNNEILYRILTASSVPLYGLHGTSVRGAAGIVHSKEARPYLFIAAAHRSEDPIRAFADLTAITRTALNYSMGADRDQSRGVLFLIKPDTFEEMPTRILGLKVRERESYECGATCFCAAGDSATDTDRQFLRLIHDKDANAGETAVRFRGAEQFGERVLGMSSYAPYDDDTPRAYDVYRLVRRLNVQAIMLQHFARLGALKSLPVGGRELSVDLSARAKAAVSQPTVEIDLDEFCCAPERDYDPSVRQ